MRRQLLILAGLLVVASTATAQIDYSVNNLTRYGNGKQSVGLTDTQFKEYIENQANVRLYLSNFTVGFQYQYDDPPEFGPNYQGIKQRYVEFSREGLELRLGDFYTLYGKGLSMNLFEDRGINYDTKLDGFRGIYQNKYIRTIGATGTMTYYDLVNYAHKETYSVKSGHVEVTPLDFIRVGASVIGANGEIPSGISFDGVPQNHQVDAELREGMLTLSGYGFDVFGSYVHKKANVLQPVIGSRFERVERSGEGVYGSVIYASDFGFGATFEYKRYAFDIVDPESRAANRPTKVLPFQNPPTVFKEHSFYLLSRNPHTIDFNDEVGMQLDMFYSLNPEMTVNVNASQASRIKSWQGRFGNWKVANTNDLLPSSDREFSPFYEVYADLEWYFDGQSYLRFALNKRYDAIYEDAQQTSHIVHSFTVPVRVEYMLDETYSIGGSLEQQWYFDSAIKNKDGESTYYNQYIAVTFASAPVWTLTLRMEYTTEDTGSETTFISGQNFWRALEMSYRIAGIHTITASYGNERGGIVCSNGICRNVLPFNGLRFMLMTQL